MPGPDNTILVGLSDALLANEYNLEILGSQFTTNGVAGSNSSISFRVLPGDVVQDGANTVTTDDLYNAAFLVGEQIFDGFTSEDFSFRADVNGDNVINTTDIFAIAARLSDQLVFTASLTLPPQFELANKPASIERPSEHGQRRIEAGSDNLSLQGASTDRSLQAVDDTFEDLFADKKESKVNLDSAEYRTTSDQLFEAVSLDLTKD